MSRDRQAVSDLAYLLWQRRGSPHGSADFDWSEAERQLAEQKPRDPPAGRLLDEAPATAPKKRRSAASASKARKP